MSGIMVITGGSRGIGAATAKLAAERGYQVAVNYRSDSAAAEQVVSEIEQAGGRAIAVQADMAVEADIVRLFETVDRELGRLDVLVNNAGIIDRVARVDEMSFERVDRMMRINVTGPFICAREAVRRMSTKHGGRGGAIINISSAASHRGGSGEYVDYAASKGAIDTFTEGLAKEVAAEGIRVNAIRPGVVRTEIHASGGNPDKPDNSSSGIPMGRAGEAREIATGVLWLANEEASFTTGARLDIDGGV
ncbi:NAD(P)-dependent dehydrogenase (short-subunit alcohol dehydrogenase family) [Kushneria sinocarnis]|uniref:NAD(P)-dependent dehydrogenase (Short-subunit alcohol dehydrogenase family) n=1 Tax=Kushneria sinocarnis TaxID=595502 RepID=A0A420WTP5_9GAMM|nr:glucose 1-dehydrogenase [Kushneria sinocarnis]RKQ96850.1 NAD(P)-dependent dehydrogenase (short-subunit alcohol dehydrogenase family) [Kushneria sinocarnis]